MCCFPHVLFSSLNRGMFGLDDILDFFNIIKLKMKCQINACYYTNNQCIIFFYISLVYVITYHIWLILTRRLATIECLCSSSWKETHSLDFECPLVQSFIIITHSNTFLSVSPAYFVVRSENKKGKQDYISGKASFISTPVEWVASNSRFPYLRDILKASKDEVRLLLIKGMNLLLIGVKLYLQNQYFLNKWNLFAQSACKQQYTEFPFYVVLEDSKSR